MKILLFEWFVGGGLLRDQHPALVERSLFREGFAMAGAIANDLTRAGHVVISPIDNRLTQFVGSGLGRLFSVVNPVELPQVLQSLAAESGGIVVIAPESGGRLLECHKWLDGFEHRFLSPTGLVARIGSCKQLAAEHLETAMVQSAFGVRLSNFPNTQFSEANYQGPFVVKPLDGAGSEEISFVTDLQAVKRLGCKNPKSFRIERFLPGVSASVSVVGGPNGHWILPPTRQVFAFGDCPARNSRSTLNWPGPWIGFDYPLPLELADRAVTLVRRAVRDLPEFVGHAGFDLVLSENCRNEDRIVDLNPRMTSSWVGLRGLFSENIGERMIQFALGQPCSPEPQPSTSEVHFRIDRN